MQRLLIILTILALPAPSLGGEIALSDQVLTGDGPFGMALSADGTRLFISEFGDVYGWGPEPGTTVRVFETDTLGEIGTIPVGINPEDICIASDKLGYVVNSTSADVTVFDPDALEVITTIPVGDFGTSFLFSVAEVPGHKKLYVSSGGGDFDGSDENIWIIDVDPKSKTYQEVTNTILLAGGITRFAFDATKDLAYAGLGFPNNDYEAQPDVVVIDTATDTVVDTIDINVAGTGAHGIEDVAITPDFKTLYVPVFDFYGGTSEIFVIDLASRKITNLIQVSDDYAQHGIGVSPDGTFVLVTNYLEGTVSVILASTQTVTHTIVVGQEPNEVIFNASGSLAYVTNQRSNTVSIIDFDRTVDILDEVIQGEIDQGDITNDGFINSFDNRVAAIQDDLDAGKTKSAKNKLDSLNNMLESNQESGKIAVGEEIPDDSDPSASLNDIKAGKKK